MEKVSNLSLDDGGASCVDGGSGDGDDRALKH